MLTSPTTAAPHRSRSAATNPWQALRSAGLAESTHGPHTPTRSPAQASPRSATEIGEIGGGTGGAGASPLMTAATRAQSRAEVQIGPTWPRPRVMAAPAAGSSTMGMRSCVALSPTAPQNPAGRRIDPPPSSPTATSTSPAPTAAPHPELDPPGTRRRL